VAVCVGKLTRVKIRVSARSPNWVGRLRVKEFEGTAVFCGQAERCGKPCIRTGYLSADCH